MVETITPQRLVILQMVARFPDVARERLLALKGVTAEDLDYLVRYDLVRERPAGCYRVSHFGQMALKRGG